MANSRPARLKPDTFELIDRMRTKIEKSDRYANLSHDSLINRAVKYWLDGDIDA